MGEETRNSLVRTLASVGVGVKSTFGVFRNWNEEKSLENKLAQLTLTKISLDSAREQLQTVYHRHPAGIEKDAYLFKD